MDSIDRAEQPGWADAAEPFSTREPRDLIAHEYSTEKMLEIHTAVAASSPILLAIAPKVSAPATVTIEKYARSEPAIAWPLLRTGVR
ncbi:hypothetical protein [Accumulibacter sp.]|uniref:hypothetical protein n=1 Tax=Accumulibacter sp. TaxID=2053492 RepID=UPI0025ECD059|nr:hypothetical protein [Accumulibacter sp.]MCM8624893.1 hypothetical protein [Accumulibacter sp.]